MLQRYNSTLTESVPLTLTLVTKMFLLLHTDRSTSFIIILQKLHEAIISSNSCIPSKQQSPAGQLPCQVGTQAEASSAGGSVNELGAAIFAVYDP